MNEKHKFNIYLFTLFLKTNNCYGFVRSLMKRITFKTYISKTDGEYVTAEQYVFKYSLLKNPSDALYRVLNSYEAHYPYFQKRKEIIYILSVLDYLWYCMYREMIEDRPLRLIQREYMLEINNLLKGFENDAYKFTAKEKLIATDLINKLKRYGC